MIFTDIKVMNSVFLLTHGSVLSLYNIPSKSWVHYRTTNTHNNNKSDPHFDIDPSEIKEVHFTNHAMNETMANIMIVHVGNYIRRVVYY